jgi:DMSO/TMAO reductase YedYZ molybdopterin-dependent catalytic subunit
MMRSPGEHLAHVPDGAHGTTDRPGHLRFSDTGQVGHLNFGHPPAGVRRADDHLQRVAETPVGEVQAEQCLSIRGAHRAKVTEPHAGPAADTARQFAVGALAFAGAGSLLVLTLSVGQSLGGPLCRTALLAPHGQDTGDGPNDFQINQTAAEVGVKAGETGPSWRLTVRYSGRAGNAPVRLSRARLLGMEQHTAHLPIACVEGWSTDNQAWTGVRLRDLARLAGVTRPASVLVQSLERGGAFSQAVLSSGQIMNPDSLLALRVNGADLSLDHGYPARVIVPANPGVHNTKWVASLIFRD